MGATAQNRFHYEIKVITMELTNYIYNKEVVILQLEIKKET